MAHEVNRLLQVVFASRRKTNRIELEPIETLVRESMHHAGAAIVQRLLSLPTLHNPSVPCSCGGQAAYHESRRKQVLTILGQVSLDRAYYLCPDCHHGQSPRDLELDVAGTECSPGVRRMMALVGSEDSFGVGCQQLQVLAGLDVTTKAVERHAEAVGGDIVKREQERRDRVVQLEFPDILGPAVSRMYIEMDGTQLPMVRAELEGRAGRAQGQPARTREVKLGCVFTQTKTDDQGRPIRDPASTTYTGAIETAELFGRRLYVEAFERGWDRAKRRVVLGDGAEWIWNIADQHFAGAIQIVVIWHAREHVWDLAAKLFPNDEKQRKRWAKKLIQKINLGQIETVVAAFRGYPTRKAELRDAFRIEADYFERNRHRMRYPKFRKQGLFIGSGVIEAACKTVIGSRLKQSGMFWTVRGANAIIALRCTHLSGKFEDYWASRALAA